MIRGLSPLWPSCFSPCLFIP
uniref:Uncharacterized protein n=1 Tax=Rhizophora mucronata TaxID=61149 RepID=A0A2P2QF22_RHIMU